MLVNQFEKNCGGPAVFSKDSSTEPVPHNLTFCDISLDVKPLLDRLRWIGTLGKALSR